MAIGLNNEINVHSYKDDSHQTLRGHRGKIVTVKSFGDLVVSGSLQGNILVWDPKTGNVGRPKSLFQHKTGISSITCNSKYVYTCASDATGA